jgi:2-oxoglutarate dehydrogenase E1 component
MARSIAAHPSTATLFRLDLASQGVLDEAGAASLQRELEDELEQGITTLAEKDKNADGGNPFEGSMAMPQPAYDYNPVKTGVELKNLKKVGERLLEVPEDFNLHPTISKRFLAARKKAIESGEGIDWAYAESLAFGTLLTEGHGVRLSGQDVRRGTFSQRHSVFYDSQTRERHIPLNNLQEEQGRYCVYNSLLSEAAVLGFDYGYSLLASNLLVCWEAQFGDFVNGAQVMIDQFLASSEVKWSRWAGLVLLLPHGYEGQGPEHSSARLERFLQLCANENMEVVYPSTGAQTFHMLRRQALRNFRKPLIVMTPKKFLRIETSTTDELLSGSFQHVIDDAALKNAGDAKNVSRVIYCTGKVYHELNDRRNALQRKDVAIVRVEQLYPLHVDAIKQVDARYPKSAQRVWVQEEPRNQGAYSFIADEFRERLGIEFGGDRFIGRVSCASPATGSEYAHKHEQDVILTAAIGALPAAADAKKKK